MFGAVAEFISPQPGDSPEFIEKARALAIGVARDYEPASLYVMRIDNWFGPRWLHFAGKAIGQLGIHKIELHVPPFVPDRVVAERRFVGPEYEEAEVKSPLHLEVPSGHALRRRIADFDKNAAFIWFSGESEVQRRGSVMVYLPQAADSDRQEPKPATRAGAFYVGFSQKKTGYEPTMLLEISRAEVAHLDETGRTSLDHFLVSTE